jgi:hypothetical protein
MGEARFLTSCAHSLHISLGSAFVTEEELQSGLHTLGPGYVVHLKWAAQSGGLLVGNPASLSKAPWDAREDALQYLRWKTRKARTMLALPTSMQGGEVWYNDWLSDILTIYRHVARRVAEVHEFREDDVRSTMSIDQFFMSLPLPIEVFTGYKQLSGLRQIYLDELHSQINLPNEERWQEMVETVENHGPVLHSFLMAVGRYLVPV